MVQTVAPGAAEAGPTETHRPRHRVRPVPLPALTGSGQALGGDVGLCGWSLTETTGSATARIDLYDGQDTKGTLIASVTLAANESTRDWLDNPGVWLTVGCFWTVISGSVRGVLWESIPGDYGA